LPPKTAAFCATAFGVSAKFPLIALPSEIGYL
jgi:hypothetical protein